MPGYDHKGICRHGSTSDSGLKLIFFEIKECILQDISNTLAGKSDPSEFHRQYREPFTNLKKARLSYIPFERNKRFVGQQKILTELLSNFAEHLNDQEVALYGLGGIGYSLFDQRMRVCPLLIPHRKSQIAIEFAHSIKETNPDTMVFWAFGGSRERFEHDFKEIAKRLELPGFNAPDIDVLTLVKTSLENRDGWVLIVDNAGDLSIIYGKSTSDVEMDAELRNTGNCYEDGVFKYLPRSSSGSILYTTRKKEDALRLTGDGHIIHVREMDDDDLKLLLESRLRGGISQEGVERFPDEDLLNLIHQLESLPLAIIQAASFIRYSSWSIPRYLENFRREGSESSFGPLLHNFQDCTRDRTVKNSVFRTWMITMKQLEEQDPRAAEVLWQMSFYNRQNIPYYLLLVTQIHLPQDLR